MWRGARMSSARTSYHFGKSGCGTLAEKTADLGHGGDNGSMEGDPKQQGFLHLLGADLFVLVLHSKPKKKIPAAM